jgi:eukaryotic-like serine/threonine-protein kinase
MSPLAERELFDAALDLPPGERSAYLVRVCADDAMRQRVEALLAAHEHAGTQFMGTPAPALAARADDQAGRRIGAYQVIRELGHGGMGTVYLAVRADDAYRKLVAIKLVHTLLDGDSASRQFRRERQLLAELEHPYIARLIDGGTTDDGVPYLVMDYVDGAPIDVYCRDRALGLRERLQLFLAVCEAVQHAHAHLIVHRDLKPQNVLVSADGTPRLLDFGVATLVTQQVTPGATLTQTVGFTPQYASPEQLRGERVTTASDVYSLGLILYELLTGGRAYTLEGMSPTDAMRIVVDDTPARPSAAVRDGAAARPRDLRGDLDTIVMTALQKEPARRYATVAALAADLVRHLEGRPVTARGNSVAYTATRFVKRHKLGAAAAAAIVLSLVGGMAATARQAQIATVQRNEADRQRARAERRFADVRRLANSFLFEFHDAIATLPGSTEARQLVVTKALEYLDGLAAEATDDVSLQRELALAYDRVGDVQGNQSSANLGDVAGAQASYQKALAIRQRLADAEPNALDTRLQLAVSSMKVGDAAFGRGAVQEAAAAYRAALAPRQDALTGGVPSAEAARAALVEVTGRLCTVLLAVGDVAGAVDNCRQNWSLTGALLEARPDDQATRSRRATSGTVLGNALRMTRQLDEAEATLLAAAKLHGELLAANPNNTDVRRRLAVTHGYLANIFTDRQQPDAAARSLGQAVDELGTLAAADASNYRVRTELAYMLNRQATTLTGLGRLPEARRASSRSLSLLRSATERPGAGGEAFNEYAWALVTVEPADMRRPAEALTVATEALRRAGGANPVYEHTLGWAYHRLGRSADAVKTLEGALGRLPADASGPALGLRRQIEADLTTFRGTPTAR